MAGQYLEYFEIFQQHNEKTIGTISGISHGSEHCSHRMDQIARRLVVTFRRGHYDRPPEEEYSDIPKSG